MTGFIDKAEEKKCFASRRAASRSSLVSAEAGARRDDVAKNAD